MGPEIVVNGRFLSRRMTGVERYAAGILGALGGRVRILQPQRSLQGLSGHAWEQAVLPPRLPVRSLLWSPANTGPLAVSHQVLTLHDLSALENPGWFSPAFALWYRLFLPPLVRRVRRVLTPSEYVRRKVMARFGLSNRQVAVVPGGVDGAHFHPNPTPAGLGRYVLFVGSLQPRKNLGALLAAWKSLAPHFPQHRLLLAGAPASYFRRGLPPDLGVGVQRMGYVPESHLPDLYAGAEAFVLPSLEEGFGLPLLEAMACGTPVVAAAAGALPEVAGAAGLFFDPADPQALALQLERLLCDPSLRAALSEKGLRRAASFPWSLAAAQTWQHLEECYAA